MPTEMSVGPATMELAVHETGTVTAVCAEGGVTWTSDDDSVVSVRKTGSEAPNHYNAKVTGESEGEAAVYAVSRDDPLRKVGLTVRVG